MCHLNGFTTTLHSQVQETSATSISTMEEEHGVSNPNIIYWLGTLNYKGTYSVNIIRTRNEPYYVTIPIASTAPGLLKYSVQVSQRFRAPVVEFLVL